MGKEIKSKVLQMFEYKFKLCEDGRHVDNESLAQDVAVGP